MKVLSAASEVESYIRGQYNPGERLPSERELALAVNKSRTVVRSVLQKLTAQNYIELESPRTRIISNSAKIIKNDKDELTSKIIGTIGYGKMLTSNNPDALLISDKRKFGLIDALNRSQYMGLIIPDNSIEELQKSYYQNMLRGLIYFDHDPVLERVLKTYFHPHIPIVSFADTCLATNFENRFFDTVTSNQYQGGKLIIEAIAQKGRKRVLYLNTTNNLYMWQQERMRGMLEACNRCNVQFFEVESIDNRERDHDIDLFNFCTKMIAKNIHELFCSSTPPDTIIVTSDGNLALAIIALEILGIDPNKLFFVGYDNTYKANYSPIGKVFTPDITVDKQDVLIGKTAVELLTQRISGELDDRLYNYTIEPILIDNYTK